MKILPHAASILESVGAALEGAIEMAMDLVLAGAALVKQSELEESAHVVSLAGQCDEDGDVGGVVLGILAIRVEVDSPLEPSDREVVARDVLPHPDPLCQRVPSYREIVRAVHRLRHGPRAARRAQPGARGRGRQHASLFVF